MGKIFASQLSDNWLISKIETDTTYKWKINNLTFKWAEHLNRYYSKEDIQKANRYMKTCLT